MGAGAQVMNPPTAIHVPMLPSFAAAGIAHAVRAGDLLFLSGQIAIDKDGAIVGAGDVRAQISYIFEILKAILAQEGGSLRNIAKLTTFYLDEADFPMIAEVRRGQFADDYRPASSSFCVKALPYPGSLVEVEAIAVLDGRR